MDTAASETYGCDRDRHLFGPGPKRILSLDGGGVRGAISVAFLERIEKLLDEHTKSTVRLGDWFDLIGGTSTGAIIAGALALGCRVSEVKSFYIERASQVFEPRWKLPYLRDVLVKFDARKLRGEIDKIVKDLTLESTDIITGLAIIAKRIDTGSPWILANNPKSIFWNDSTTFLANKDYPLAALVRASTAAPTFFDPEIIAVTADPPAEPLGEVPALAAIANILKRSEAGSRLVTWLRALYGRHFPNGPNAKTHGLFIDGGVSPYNNPSMALLLLVALKQFGICWELGPKNLSIISIGTGFFRTKLTFDELGVLPIKLAKTAMMSSIGDAQDLVVAQMQWLGECAVRWKINGEINGVEDNCPPGGPWFRYQRYNVALDVAMLKKYGFTYQEADAVRLQQMDVPTIINELYDIGCRVAEDQVKIEHLLEQQIRPGAAAGSTRRRLNFKAPLLIAA